MRGIEALTRASFVTATISPPPVFECAYAQLVLPWYGTAELCLRQPLHQVLTREVDAIIERVIQRARHFDVCQAVVGSIRILTQHLHNTKQPDRSVSATPPGLFALTVVSKLHKLRNAPFFFFFFLSPMNNLPRFTLC